MEIGGSTEAVQTRRPSRHLTGSARTDNRLVSGLWAGGQPGRGRLKSGRGITPGPQPRRRGGAGDANCAVSGYSAGREPGSRARRTPGAGAAREGCPGLPTRILNTGGTGPDPPAALTSPICSSTSSSGSTGRPLFLFGTVRPKPPGVPGEDAEDASEDEAEEGGGCGESRSSSGSAMERAGGGTAPRWPNR